MNTGFYLIEGRWAEAGFSAAAMIPVFGQGATVTKHGIKVSREAIETLGEKKLRKGFQELSEQALKRRADMIRHLTEDVLLKMEGYKNGHLLTKHAGKSVSFLKNRLKKEFDIEAATTFYSKDMATKAVRQNLSHNADEIAKWLANRSGTRDLPSLFVHEFPIGFGIERGKKKIKEALKVSKIILRRDPNVDVGFRIVTGFVIIK